MHLQKIIRYLFNVGEGMMRFCTEHRIKMRKIQQLFFTQISPFTCGGLPGMILTLADTGVTNLQLLGPPSLSHYLFSLRSFMKRSQLLISVTETNSTVPWHVVFQDETIVVQAMTSVIHDTYKQSLLSHADASNKYIFTNDFDMQEEEPATKKIKLDATVSTPNTHFSYRKRWNIATNMQNPQQVLPQATQCYTCYLVSTPDIPGKFDPSKAKALGLKPGPAFRKLTQGENVVTEDGTVVTPAQVIGPAQKGPQVLIVDCPSVDVMQIMLDAVLWSMDKSNIMCVVHMTPKHVLEQAKYQQFVKMFTKCNQVRL